MFTKELLTTFLSHDNSLTCTPDVKYGLYRFDRGDRYEYRMEEKFTLEKQKHVEYMETILRFYLPKDADHYGILYTILRNCLLVEREK